VIVAVGVGVGVIGPVIVAVHLNVIATVDVIDPRVGITGGVLMIRHK
jgi:hypothetical protein